jgi:hypothetical protein
MWRVRHVFHRIAKGPYGTAVTAMLAGWVAVSCMLLVGAVYDRAWISAEAIAVIAILGAQILGIMTANLQRAKLNDVHYAISLEAGLKRAGYEVADLYTDGAAANPSLQLLHLKILRLCRPERILELGSGQTTKVLSCYARDNPSVFALTLEQDESWAQRLGSEVVHDYRHVPVEGKEFRCPGTKLHIVTACTRTCRN